MRLVGNLHAEMLLGLFFRGAGAVSSFALVWMIARIYGAEVVGSYQLGITTVTLASMLVALGLPVLLVREVANLLRLEAFGDARATFVASRRFILLRGLPAAVILAVLAYPFSAYVLGEPQAAPFLIVFAPSVLMLAQLKLFNSLLRTAGRVMTSQSLEGVFYTTLAALLVAVAWASGHTELALLPAIAYLVAVTISTVIAWTMTNRLISGWPPGAAKLGAGAGLSIAAAPIMMAGGEWIILLVITTLAGLDDAGIYRTTVQICMLFQLINTSFAMMAGPHLARASGAGDWPAIKRIIRSAGLVGLGLCLPLAVLCLAAPKFLLGWFGEEFLQGALALQILVVGQAFNVAMGPVGAALVMLGRERFVLIFEIVATLAGVAIALATIGHFGIAGAALGALVSAIIRNSCNYAGVRGLLASKMQLA